MLAALALLKDASELGTSAASEALLATGEALGGGRALLVCIHFLMMWTPFHLEWGFPDPPGSD